MKKIFLTIFIAGIVLSGCTNNSSNMYTNSDGEIITIEGEFMNTKGGGSVDGVYLPESFSSDEYAGKTVRVKGRVVTVESGSTVNEAGEYSTGWESSRRVMESVESIEVIE